MRSGTRVGPALMRPSTTASPRRTVSTGLSLAAPEGVVTLHPADWAFGVAGCPAKVSSTRRAVSSGICTGRAGFGGSGARAVFCGQRRALGREHQKVSFDFKLSADGHGRLQGEANLAARGFGHVEQQIVTRPGTDRDGVPGRSEESEGWPSMAAIKGRAPVQAMSIRRWTEALTKRSRTRARGRQLGLAGTRVAVDRDDAQDGISRRHGAEPEAVVGGEKPIGQHHHHIAIDGRGGDLCNDHDRLGAAGRRIRHIGSGTEKAPCRCHAASPAARRPTPARSSAAFAPGCRRPGDPAIAERSARQSHCGTGARWPAQS